MTYEEYISAMKICGYELKFTMLEGDVEQYSHKKNSAFIATYMRNGNNLILEYQVINDIEDECILRKTFTIDIENLTKLELVECLSKCVGMFSGVNKVINESLKTADEFELKYR